MKYQRATTILSRNLLLLLLHVKRSKDRYNVAYASPTKNNIGTDININSGFQIALKRVPISACHRKPYPMLRNSASGPEIGLPGRISAGF